MAAPSIPADLREGCPPHTGACYGTEQLPCPGCGVPVTQTRLQCAPDKNPGEECMACSLKCPDCPAEIRITQGLKLYRARVIHDADCPWYRRYQVREVMGCIPCMTVVTHRGPYVRDPADR